MGDDIHIEPGAGGSGTPVSDAIDLAQTVGEHSAKIEQHAAQLAEHDGAIEAAKSSAQFAHERIDSIGSGEASRISDLESRVESLAADLTELKAAKAGDELGEAIGEGAAAVTEPVGEAAQAGEDAAVDAPAAVENVAEHEEKEASGVMGFLRKLNIH